ncbi:MAG: replication restart helicase PriA [Janthinobacterium lividum]
MSLFCDVALPVPLERSFTYRLGEFDAEIGSRVLVPFGGQRLVGFVIRTHDEAPPPEIEVKAVERVLDEAALLSADLLELGRWVAEYYCAPLGEVLRGMVPLGAEVRRRWMYRIADAGRRVLYEGAAKGSSRRSKLSVEDQNREYAVLNYLESGEPAKAPTLRSATGANKALLDAMAKKRWLLREPLAEPRDARRVEQIAVVVKPVEATDDDGSAKDISQHAEETSGRRLPKLNDNQLAVMAELAGAGDRERVRELQVRLARAGVPETTLGTLVRRGLVRLEEAPQAFHLSSLGNGAGKRFAHEHTLNEAQTEALASIAAAMGKGGFQPHLLYGITGSGKTAVYVAAMQRVLAAGQSALLLVPEIGLTPATAAQMVAAFGSEVALLHSQLTPDERAEQWHRIQRGEARIVIGTRSAVFAPMQQLGLILVDEEHDGSYKQEETPRYHGRDVAVMRAKLLGCPVVLGSATPSLESWHNTEIGRYKRLEILARVNNRPLPVVETIDMREEFRSTGQEQLFSRQLIEETQATLDRGEQAIILLNRRGYSFVVMCRSCGEKIECENCAISLTFHKAGSEADLSGPARVGERLECHYCGFRRGVPERCPKCQSEHLFFLGAGSQQGEERLAELFPGARLGRMDRDTVRTRGDMERLLERLHSGEINLLVGTQMIAKGHDIHGVTLVGVVGADFALGLPDFRAAERVFQLLTQVSGRAGRGDLPGRVLVQSYQPDHYVHQFARKHDFTGFAAREMSFRRGARYPPMTALANVIVQSESLTEALAWAGTLGRWLAANRPPELRVLGPAAAPISRLKRIYRYHFVLRAERRSTLRASLRGLLACADADGIPRRSLVIDVDALHLM